MLAYNQLTVPLHEFEEGLITLDRSQVLAAHDLLMQDAKVLRVVHCEGTNSSSPELLESALHRPFPTG